jgi:hypothetical protein
MSKLYLPNVTLICVTGHKFPEHQKAIEKSCEGIQFGAVKTIIKKFDSSDEWSKYIVYNLTDYVETDYCLLIHADGYVIHPELWNPKWLGYDFCGSPWPLPKDTFSYRDENGKIIRVGNSVGLRSKKLLDLPRKLNLPWEPLHGYLNEDGMLTVKWRTLFESHGITYIPFEEALIFGREAPLPEYTGDTFLFHTYD